MNRIILAYFIAIAALSSCTKVTSDALKNNTPDVAVTVSNAYGMFNYPAVATSLSGGGTITIKLSIPATSGHTIKEISRVALGATGSSYGVVQKTTGLYNAAPIPGNGITATFTTSLAEYTTKTGTTVTTGGTATSFLGNYFFFLITIDNNEQVISPAVRVYVNS